MSQNGKRVVVFEDDDANFQALQTALTPLIASTGASIVRYPGTEEYSGRSGALIAGHVEAFLTSPTFPVLVVLDWDLSKYTQPVNRELVRGLCNQLGVPLCTYETGHGAAADIKRLQRWQQSEVAIDSLLQPPQIAAKCASILTGFDRIQTEFGGKKRLRDTIVKLLRPPESAFVQLDQYAWGTPDFLRIADVPLEARGRHAATGFGYWLHNSLLQFPGVLLNPRAAASYLGVDPDEFARKEDCQHALARAAYEGPFRELGPYWWTSSLDEIRATAAGDDSDLASGPELFRKLGNFSISPARCSHDHEASGFICIVTGKVVCIDHSVKPAGWLPMGADLSRIEKDTYEQLSAWVEL